LNQATKTMIRQLEKNGLVPTKIPAFIRSVLITICGNHHMGLWQINRELHSLGWNTFEIDDHTWQIIISSLEAEGLISAERYKPNQLFKSTNKLNLVSAEG